MTLAAQSADELEAELAMLARAFYEKAERERRWSIFEDLPWEAARARDADELAFTVETFFALEASAPALGARALEAMRISPALTSFVSLWTADKSKRILALREWLLASGRTSHALSTIERASLTAPLGAFGQELHTDDRSSARRLLFYGCLQAMVAFVTYAKHREIARRAGDECLRTLYDFVARDDIAHARFLEASLKLFLEQDRVGTLRDMGNVLSDFSLPGRTALPNWELRMEAIRGPGLDLATFIQRVYVPVLRHLGVQRHELLVRPAGVVKAQAKQTETGTTRA